MAVSEAIRIDDYEQGPTQSHRQVEILPVTLRLAQIYEGDYLDVNDLITCLHNALSILGFEDFSSVEAMSQMQIIYHQKVDTTQLLIATDTNNKIDLVEFWSYLMSYQPFYLQIKDSFRFLDDQQLELLISNVGIWNTRRMNKFTGKYYRSLDALSEMVLAERINRQLMFES